MLPNAVVFNAVVSDTHISFGEWTSIYQRPDKCRRYQTPFTIFPFYS